ncbi:putative phosphoglycerate mutase [Cryobacterium mesophilum]|uniref:Histidine phosphatase family protein n=1 Tax=Terrimesophilobacter mesophilus TaxID=433647 RepID=A0A4V3I996_9MICO|nr:histidine phosphatase family protein [Terrimesophilobacter mesophilus]MBB5634103.1 putative phosphoglycerate mutase [Terrimesophilobacter mesophilus]TFB78688.1 histidine phosphatase family protein [Terrimesophilobacter mesophilus]
MRLLLIRHGQTPGNVLGQLDTAHPGPGLTELGRTQAEALATSLSDAGVAALYASTLVRTQLTAAPLSAARRLEVEVLSGLHEIGAGELEARSDRESIRRYLETLYAWGLGDLDAALPGGSDGNEFFGRFDADVATIASAGVDVAAVFSHGAAIRVWAANRARNVLPAFGAENNLDNTGVVTLEGSVAEGWTLTDWAGTPIAS